MRAKSVLLALSTTLQSPAAAFLNTNNPFVRSSSSSSSSSSPPWTVRRSEQSSSGSNSVSFRSSASSIYAISPGSLNEFSRSVDPERIPRHSRTYALQITATEDECRALAYRFEVPAIHSLAANLTLRQDAYRSREDGVEIQGTILAAVTRKCVRTNEYFRLDDLQVPLYAVVRPVTPILSIMALEESIMPKEDDRRGDKDQKKERKSSYRPQDRNIDEIDVLQLQRMLQQGISTEDDALVEDEAIYATGGMIDAGELVAQLFWLSLDPYPKKPGTDPLRFSISTG